MHSIQKHSIQVPNPPKQSRYPLDKLTASMFTQKSLPLLKTPGTKAPLLMEHQKHQYLKHRAHATQPTHRLLSHKANPINGHIFTHDSKYTWHQSTSNHFLPHLLQSIHMPCLKITTNSHSTAKLHFSPLGPSLVLEHI
jgi:hypothetical protein